jgi:carboxyl-terminal processing protease
MFIKWLTKTLILLIGLSLGVILCKYQHSFSKQNNLEAKSKNDWQANENVLLYLEASSKILKHDYFFSSELTDHNLLEESLSAYLQKKDPYSAFFSAKEYWQWKISQGDDYYGVGLEIVKNKQGHIICIPIEDSPAYKAGIRPGDRLLAIDDQRVTGKSIMAVAALSRNINISTLKFTVKSSAGDERTVLVSPTHVNFESVTFISIGTSAIIKISSFTTATKDKLERILEEQKNLNPIILDLRENAGGNLHVAIEAAKLFLAEGKLIVTVKSRHNSENYMSGKKGINLNSSIYLWMNETTASAAEVFAAALIDNDRAVSIGKKSFGKGTQQEVIELSDGSALYLTSATLITPKGNMINDIGIEPNFPLSPAKPGTDDYFDKTKILLKKASAN